MRVVHVIGARDSAAWAPVLLGGLRRSGLDVVAIIDRGGTGLRQRIEAVGVECHETPLGLSRRLVRRGRADVPLLVTDAARFARNVVRLAILLRRLRPDVVHAHLFNAMLLTRLAAPLARVRRVISMVPGPLHLETWPTRWADRLTVRLDTVTIGACDYTNRLYGKMGVPPSRRGCVYYGVDAARFDPSAVDRKRVRAALGVPDGYALVVHVAVFYPPQPSLLAPAMVRRRGVKRHEDLILAATHVIDRRPKTRFLLVGSGVIDEGERYRDRLAAMAEDLGYGQDIRFLGSRDDIPEILASADIAVQCSVSESLGGTLESLAMGVPTVATDAGGMAEIIKDEETGMLVSPEQPLALARAILRLIDDPDTARRLASEGQRRVREVGTLDTTVRRLHEVYDRL